MSKRLQSLLWLTAAVLIGNFIILRIYGDTLQSTHLFVARGTVFYPFALLNLIAGLALTARLILELRRGRGP